MRYLLLCMALFLSGCESHLGWLDRFIYRIDIPQGNFLEQKDVDKLRVGMNKEQVAFILGNPIADNAFRTDKWVYLYQIERGDGSTFRQELMIQFNQEDKIIDLSGDFEKSAQFTEAFDG